MGKKITEDGRYRLFFLELYHDTESYDYDSVKRILKSMGKYAYITHDKDLSEDGTLKKIHDHWIIKLDNAMTGRAFQKKTGVPLQFCQEIQNERSCCRYLIHTDDEDKYQYKKEDVHCSSNYQRQFLKCFTELETEEQQLSNIYNFISKISLNEKNKHNALFYLIEYVNSNCYDTIYKRYRFEIKDYLNSLY